MKRNGTTRKTFLGVLGAALFAPALAGSTGRQIPETQPASAQPAGTRQARLRAIFAHLEAASDGMREVRREMLAGIGPVEDDGALVVEFEGPLEPEENYSSEWDTLESYGLLLRRRR